MKTDLLRTAYSLWKELDELFAPDESRRAPASQGSLPFMLNASQQSNHPSLSNLAREEYEERGRRQQHFESDLFGEPCWDILLDLYIANAEAKDLPVTSLTIGSRVPASTALRWITVLAERGYIERYRAEHDGRVNLCRLSAKAKDGLDRYFSKRLTDRNGL